jgi:hypothetical protein
MKILWKKCDWELIGGKLTRILGPPLILLATALVSCCAYLFFILILPFLSLQVIPSILLKSFAFYIVVCVGFHYLMCIFTDAGTPNRPEDTIVIYFN